MRSTSSRQILAALVAAILIPLTASASGPPTEAWVLERQGGIARWDEAMPLGNGLQGALVWGEGRTLRISLDRGDLWDARRPDVMTSPDWTWATIRRLRDAGDFTRLHALFDVPYDTVPYPTKLPGGRIELTFDPHTTIRRFVLNPFAAVVMVDLDGATVTVRMDAELGCGILTVAGNQPTIRIVRPAGLDRLGYEPGEMRESAGEWTLRQRAADGLSYAVVVGRGAKDLARAAFRAAFTIGVARGGDPLAAARATIARALEVPESRGLKAHLAWWRAFWSGSSVWLPDFRLQRQYDLVKYFYGAASRPDAPPIPLQGVWTADDGNLPPWKGDYHHDLNTQMTYLAYHAAGLTNQGASFLNQLWSLRPAFRRFAHDFYGVDGLIVPGVMTLDGASIGGWAQYSLSPTNTAWVAQSFYLQWKYTADSRFLRDRAYPWCAEAGRALLAILAPDASGRLKLPLSSSPEIFDNSPQAWLPPNSNYDLSLIRFLFGANAEMAEAAGDPAAAQTWREALAHMGPLDIDSATRALTFAQGYPYRESHRHFSHAMAIYPLGLLDAEGSDADQATIRATLDEIEQRGTRAWVGYSLAWMSAMAARVGQADRALSYLKTFERAFIGPNGFHLNGDQTKSGLSDFTYRPFTLEGNFLAMQAIHEMLLQGQGGVIRIFPATSAAWEEASFSDLRAEGGWRVSAIRAAGRTTSVRVQAAAGGVLRLRDPFDGRAPHWNRPDVRRDGRDYVVRLKKGETLRGRHQVVSSK